MGQKLSFCLYYTLTIQHQVIISNIKGTNIKHIYVGVCFALTTEAYGLIYGGEPLALFMIDGGYMLVGYAMVAAIWSFFD